MNDAIATQGKYTAPSTMLHTLTLAFAALTLLFALLSLILGSRLSTLQTHFLMAEKETATSEAASIQSMETKLKTAMDKLENAQKRLNEEKATAERLQRQLAGVMKDFEKTKADLSSANQTIVKLKSTVPAQSPHPAATPEPNTTPIVAPSTGTVLSQDPLSPAAPKQKESSLPEPTATQTPAQPSGTPEKQAAPPTLPAAGRLPSESPPPVAQETITGSPKAPSPATAPAVD